MRKLLGYFLFFLCCAAGLAAVNIRGKVISSDGTPVEEAVVLHRESGRKTLTDSNGFFQLEIPSHKKGVLEVIHPHYLEKQVSFSEENASQPLTVRLLPYVRQKEDIVVTALRYPETSSSIPVAESSVTEEDLETKLAPNIAKSLKDIPGVSSIGSGGFSIVPNIRGLARRRVLLLLDNARITSDRRTGPNASFVNPNSIEKIEVLRSPSSVFYGSDAMGGVIHILTKKPSFNDRVGGSLYAAYGSVNREKSMGFSLEGRIKKTGSILSFQRSDAENYSSPERLVPQSQYSQGSLLWKIVHQTEKREIQFSFLGARGSNIGKPQKDSLMNPAWYPKESQNFLNFQWHEKNFTEGGEFTFHFYLNPNYLETQKETIQTYKTQMSFSRTQSLDYGVQFSFGKKFSFPMRFKGGADIYGRTRVEAENVYTEFDSSGRIQNAFTEWPFRRGRRSDIGFFLSLDYFGIENIDLVSGIRLDLIRLNALPEGASLVSSHRFSTWTGFMGGSVKLTDKIVVFANLARAYRAPSLNELFYTGITGRGFVISRPGLNPERSINLDGGIKFFDKRAFAGIYGFYYEISDLIERYKESEKIYTYGNINKGQIKGIEGELEIYPVSGWKIFGHFYSLYGKSLRTQLPLNDIPSLRVFFGTKFWIKRFSLEIISLINAKKTTPGPAEVELPGYETVDIRASYFLRNSFRFYFVVSNVLNKFYIGHPDPDAVEEPGRNVELSLRYSF